MTMQASDISNELLTEMLITEGPWLYREQCQALARAEVDRRQADKREKHSLQHAANCALWLLDCPELKPIVCGKWGDPAAVRQMLLDAGCVPSCKITEAAITTAKEGEKVDPEPTAKCTGCGCALNVGEASVFTACSLCWDKQYAKKPTPPAPVVIEPILLLAEPFHMVRVSDATKLNMLARKTNELIDAVNKLNEGRAK